MDKIRSIAFFGCWGKLSEGTPPFEKVLKEIEAKGAGRLIVAGDNYYVPKSKEGVKTFGHVDALNILGKLPDVAVELLTGNHEMDPEKMVGSSDHCDVVKSELNAVDLLNQSRIKPITIRVDESLRNSPSLGRQVFADGDDLYVCCDTSMFEYKNQADMECYSAIFGSTGDQSAFIRHQKENLEQQLQTFGHVRRLIFVGHHPFYIFRYKPASESKKKSKPASVATDLNLELLDFVCDLAGAVASYESLHYLCADFHAYQHLTATYGGRTIDVHIVGTGGADLDTPYEGQSELLQESVANKGGIVSVDPVRVDYPEVDLNVTLLSSQKAYGYLAIYNEGMQFVFVQEGGRKTKRRRRRTRSTRRRR